MTDLIFIAIILIWLALAAATFQVFTRKGQSVAVAILVGIFFGPLALIIGLIMPTDQVAIEENKRRQDARLAEKKRYYDRLQSDYAVKQLANGDQPIEMEQRQNTISYISAGALILCPIAMIFVTSEPLGIGLGMATVFGLIGLATSN